MKTEFRDYLKRIGATEPVINTVENIYKNCAEICPEEIKDIFISEYVGEEGQRIYENAWFISEKYLMEAKNFTNSENFDLVSFSKKINRIKINKRDYELKNANTKSRIELSGIISVLITLEMKASKENCDQLMKIIKKYFVPNIVD